MKTITYTTCDQIRLSSFRLCPWLQEIWCRCYYWSMRASHIFIWCIQVCWLLEIDPTCDQTKSTAAPFRNFIRKLKIRNVSVNFQLITKTQSSSISLSCHRSKTGIRSGFERQWFIYTISVIFDLRGMIYAQWNMLRHKTLNGSC